MAKFTKEERKYLKQFDDGWKDVLSGGIDRLNKQYEKGKGQARHELKKESGHAQLNIITSEGSWTRHVSAFSVFGKWCKKEGIERFHIVTQDDVERFLYYQETLGKKYGTITGYQTALNHVFFGSDVEGHPEYSAHQLSITDDGERRNNLMIKEQETRDSIPDKYNAQIDLLDFFGLRRDELTKVGTKSFYEVDGDYFVSVIGKNGRARYAEALQSSKSLIKERYSDMIIKLDTKDDIPRTSEEVKEVYSTQKELFDRDIPNKYSIHVLRARYAQNFYEELKANGNHKTEDEYFKLNDDFQGNRGLFRKISKSLGHNRVDRQLMSSYLRKE